MQCPICGRELLPTTSATRVYCSQRCRQRAFRRRKPQPEAPGTDLPRRPRRAAVAQIQAGRRAKGLPILQLDPELEREAEIRALKRLVQELEQGQRKALIGRGRLFREVTLEQAVHQPDPEAVYLGVGYARSARTGRRGPLVLLFGKDERAR